MYVDGNNIAQKKNGLYAHFLVLEQVVMMVN